MWTKLWHGSSLVYSPNFNLTELFMCHFIVAFKVVSVHSCKELSAFTGRPEPEATISLFSRPLNADGWETSRGEFQEDKSQRKRWGESFGKVGVGKHKFQRTFVPFVVRITSCAQFVCSLVFLGCQLRKLQQASLSSSKSLR